MSARAQRRREEREALRRAVAFRLTGDETCDRCGRHLDDGPPDLPTCSVDVGGGEIWSACGYCAPVLREAVEQMIAGSGSPPGPGGSGRPGR
jgi:hypothetical protein